MSSVMDIADAVAAELNAAPAGAFDPGFTAVRPVLPEFTLAELADFRVAVVPRSLEFAGSTRSSQQVEIAIHIGGMKKLGTDLDGEVTALVALVEQIATYLASRRLRNAADAAWVRMANDPIYSPQHLASQRTFTSVLTVTYLTMR